VYVLSLGDDVWLMPLLCPMAYRAACTTVQVGVDVQVMTSINVNARQRGRVIDYKDVLYGYRRVNPLHGADYMLDLLLVYRKFKGRRRMTIPVRRHAYLQQAFLEPDFHVIGPAMDPLSYSSDTVESLSLKSATTTVHLVLPLAGRYEAFRQFMDNFEWVCTARKSADADGGSAGEVVLLIVLFTDEGSSGELDLIKSRVSASQQQYPALSVSVVHMSGRFSRGAGLQHAARLLPRHSLMFFIDVDIQFTADALRRVQLAVAIGRSAYYPIVFSQYDPSMASGGNFTSSAGCWRDFGYGIVAVYNADFADAGGFNLDIRGWGHEDVDLVERLLARNVSVFRAVDPGLTHVFHAKHCDPGLDAAQYQMCLGSRASAFASLKTLADFVRHTPEIYHRADTNGDSELPARVNP